MISTQPESLRIKSGKIYYEYYCVFCHGTPGQGIGPVGHSFVPTPRDLSTTGVLSLTDSALIRIIVNSPSHNPLLPYVISPEHRKAIATYVRNIGRLREM
jgi:mono/diheme cytochrome c family protein